MRSREFVLTISETVIAETEEEARQIAADRWASMPHQEFVDYADAIEWEPSSDKDWDALDAVAATAVTEVEA